MTTIDVNYEYTFETTKTETFTVYPRQTTTTMPGMISSPGGNNPSQSTNNPGGQIV
jgi:hypothetical protein